MIDIIIPVYNTPIKDLERCLNSIENQTYKNYLVYIIDDGSNNDIKEYLDSINKDNYIIKHISNNGVSNARNIGIELSNNPYVCFVDSDDTIEPLFLEESFKIMKNNNLDLIIGGFNEIKLDSIKIRTSQQELTIFNKDNIILFLDKLISSKNTKENEIIGSSPVGRIYGRLFKRELATKVLFNTNVKMSEDTLYMIEVSRYANKIGITNKIWYNYYKNDYSVSKNIDASKNIPFIKEIVKKIDNENSSILINSYKFRIFKTIYNNYELVENNEIKEIIDKYLKNVPFNYININEKEKNIMHKLLG